MAADRGSQGLKMAVLDTDGLLVSQPLMRRAHLVLTFLLHFYVHSSPPSSSPRISPLEVPASLSVPLLAISPLLGLPPVVTYADTVLYNFLALDPTSETSLPTNPPTRCLATFTGTRSEEQFFIISALCEVAGAEALRLMRRSLDELFVGDAVAIRRLTVYLRKLATQIDRIGDITLSIMNEVDPEEFYHLIRPWFRGGDADGPKSLGWAYLGLEGSVKSAAENQSGGTAGLERASTQTGGAESSIGTMGSQTQPIKGSLFSGPSAGQSSLIHAIDIFLTVDHSPKMEAQEDEVDTKVAGPIPQQSSSTSSTSNAPIMVDATPVPKSGSSPASQPNEATFVERMLQYMPLPHRTFILHLSTHPTPLRTLVIAHAHSSPRLTEAYDGALDALKRFREKHMRVVSVFIIQQARRRPSERVRKILGTEDVEDGQDIGDVDVADLRGTGGSPLFKFLKRCRDNTTEAMIGKSGAPSFELV